MDDQLFNGREPADIARGVIANTGANLFADAYAGQLSPPAAKPDNSACEYLGGFMTGITAIGTTVAVTLQGATLLEAAGIGAVAGIAAPEILLGAAAGGVALLGSAALWSVACSGQDTAPVKK